MCEKIRWPPTEGFMGWCLITTVNVIFGVEQLKSFQRISLAFQMALFLYFEEVKAQPSPVMGNSKHKRWENPLPWKHAPPSPCKCIALFLSRFIQHKLSRPPPKCWLTIYFNMTSNPALKIVILLLNDAMNAFINLRHSYIQHTAWKLIDWETQWLGMMAHFD